MQALESLIGHRSRGKSFAAVLKPDYLDISAVTQSPKARDSTRKNGSK